MREGVGPYLGAMTLTGSTDIGDPSRGLESGGARLVIDEAGLLLEAARVG